MFDLLDDLYAEENFDPGFPIIYDFTGSTALGYRLDLIPFLERLRKSRSLNSKQKKIGIILSTLNQKFLASLFVKVSDSLNLQVQLFENSHACVNWITDDHSSQEKLTEMLSKNRLHFVG
jgi:hypothetical protein